MTSETVQTAKRVAWRCEKCGTADIGDRSRARPAQCFLCSAMTGMDEVIDLLKRDRARQLRRQYFEGWWCGAVVMTIVWLVIQIVALALAQGGMRW